jgi:hypothetical protein
MTTTPAPSEAAANAPPPPPRIRPGRRPSPGRSSERAQLGHSAAQRYQAGSSIRAIAAELGRSYTYIRLLLLQTGVVLRSRTGRPRT